MVLTDPTYGQTKFDNDPEKKSVSRTESGLVNGKDKTQHTIFAAVATAGAYALFRGGFKLEPIPAVAASCGLVLAAGYVKETIDPRYDIEDIRVNYIGAVPVCLSMAVVQWWKK